MDLKELIEVEKFRERLKSFDLYYASQKIFVVMEELGTNFEYNTPQIGNLYKTQADFAFRKGQCYIRLISIEKSKRNRGYGTQLVKIIEDFAREEGCEVVRLASMPNARTFWEKSKYTYAGHTNFVKKLA